MDLETDVDTLDSSASTEIQDAAAASPPAEAAESSAADGAQAAEESALSVVRDVVGKRPEAPASPADGSETGDIAGEKAPKEPDNENFSDVPFHKHPRFQEVLRQRREFKVDAERYRNVQAFLDNSGMTADEAANGLVIMAQAKHDPVAAWKAIKPWVQNLLLAAGEIVPDDLAGRVRSGELTAEAAAEIARARAQAQTATSAQQFATQQQETRAERERIASVQRTVTEWENDRRTKDPNFAAKFPLLQREIVWLHQQEGRPATADGARDQLARAYEAVNKQFRPPTPKPAAKPAIRPVTGGTTAAAAPETGKSTLDIIKQVQARRNG